MLKTALWGALIFSVVLVGGSGCSNAELPTPTETLPATSDMTRAWEVTNVDIGHGRVVVDLLILDDADVLVTLDEKAPDEMSWIGRDALRSLFESVTPGVGIIEVSGMGQNEIIEIDIPVVEDSAANVPIPGLGIPFPNIYGGRVYVDGKPAPDRLEVFARIGEYQTPIDPDVTVVENGKYRHLIIGPPNRSFIGETVTFHSVFNGRELQATETSIFQPVDVRPDNDQPSYLLNQLDLNFRDAEN